MNLVVDYGNTHAKVGIFTNGELTHQQSFGSDEELKSHLQSIDHEHIIVSSVKTDAQQILSWSASASKKLVLHHTLPLPVKIHYTTPHTLGVDRMAGVCGAHRLFPTETCLVIDAGTCITYDIVDPVGNYWGGNISPGLNMRFKAMHTLTSRLPLIQPTENVLVVGDSTEHAMQSGVILGIEQEMRGMIKLFEQKFGPMRVILCGGDTSFFENRLKNSIFASPELVLVGLNSILEHNVQ